MSTSTGKVIAKARELLSTTPDGIRYAQLHQQISTAYPDIPLNTIHGALHKFRSELPADIYQPSKGLYQHISFREESSSFEPQLPAKPASPKIREDEFYEPFADWLVNELEECTNAIPVGGNIFKDKWGTPDVIGVREAKRSDIIKPPTEIVTAEIKLDLNGLITAFGQACSYKLFCHRAYIVVPQNSSEEDISRLDALARIFGIGFILFDATSPKYPRFTIRVRASRHEPDMFYVNKYLKLIEAELF
ncbi:MAG: hypothetical protein ACKVT0_08415 [Planctomycetaceae bacterium]